MRVSVSIMAHPERQAGVDRLLARLGPVPVAWDMQGGPRRDHDRVWRNCRRAWELADPAADWHMVLQDDALVCDDLVDGVEYALKHIPDPVVMSLYMGAGTPLPRLWGSLAARARAEGASWIVGPRSTWGVGLVIPTRLIGDMLEFGDRHGSTPDDMRIGRWARARGIETWFPFPSFVDHDDEQGSLLGHHLRRRAHEHLVGSALHDFEPLGDVVRAGR